jgi:hypothetical protein
MHFLTECFKGLALSGSGSSLPNLEAVSFKGKPSNRHCIVRDKLHGSKRYFKYLKQVVV